MKQLSEIVYLDIEENNTYFKKPVLIFTDVYFDDGDEEKAELLLEAKSIGAICIKDDIAYVRKNILKYCMQAIWFGNLV